MLAAVEAAEQGLPIEDDLVECKGAWPDAMKAKQFAGLCNKARGHPVILIIGLDETTHKVTPVTSTDPADWWAAFSARFDEVAPDLAIHMVVPLDNGRRVVALQFDTDRVPYVVKSSDGAGPHREIPIRDGTGTRAAYRHEILKMLGPTINLPTVSALDASLTVYARERKEPATAEECHRFSGVVHLYLEHLTPNFAMIPTHRIKARLEMAGVDVEADVQTVSVMWFPRSEQKPTPPPPPLYGVDARPDGLLITGSGRTPLYLSGSVAVHDYTTISTATSATIGLALYVDGSEVPLRLVINATRDDHEAGTNQGLLTFRT